MNELMWRNLNWNITNGHGSFWRQPQGWWGFRGRFCNGNAGQMTSCDVMFDGGSTPRLSSKMSDIRMLPKAGTLQRPGLFGLVFFWLHLVLVFERGFHHFSDLDIFRAKSNNEWINKDFGDRCKCSVHSVEISSCMGLVARYSAPFFPHIITLCSRPAEKSDVLPFFSSYYLNHKMEGLATGDC